MSERRPLRHGHEPLRVRPHRFERGRCHGPARLLTRLGLLLGLILLASAALLGTGAGAQTPGAAAAHPTPVLTVSDPQIAPCGTITATGAAFKPTAEIAVSVSGQALPDKVFSDAAGEFTFETTVKCDQLSGVVPVQADDGATSIAIQVAIVAPKATTTVVAADAASGPTPTSSSGFDRWAVPAARAVLLLIMAIELVVLVRWRNRRVRLRQTPLDAR